MSRNFYGGEIRMSASAVKFEKGDRVKRVDADAPGKIPAYRDLRGVVAEVRSETILVDWDCDRNVRRLGPTPLRKSELAHATELS